MNPPGNFEPRSRKQLENCLAKWFSVPHASEQAVSPLGPTQCLYRYTHIHTHVHTYTHTHTHTHCTTMCACEGGVIVE